MTRIAVPLSRCAMQALVDVPRGADVDTAGRLRDQQHAVARRDSSRARISFWMLPPERLLSGRVEPGVLTSNASTSSSQCRRMTRSRRKPKREKGRCALSISSRFSATREVGDDAVAHPLLGHVAEPALPHLGRRGGPPLRRRRSGSSPRRRRAQAGDRLGELALPVPRDTPAMPTISPDADLQAQARGPPRCRDRRCTRRSRTASRTSPRGRRAPASSDGELVADHHLGQLVAG